MGIYQEEIVLIAPESFGEIHCQEDLIGKEIFMWTEGCPYRAALEDWLRLKNISLPITSITSYATILGCVSAGSGVSLVRKVFLSNIKI